jgi:5-methylcytosine-specific restriction endonuclease McrA
MDAALREMVRRRARGRCEYCGIPQKASPLIPFHVEHIVAKQHEVIDHPDNLALACDRCNAYKGPNLSSVDPETGRIVLLFSSAKRYLG